MYKNLIIIGIAVLFICVVLSGCNEREDDSQSQSSEEKRFFGTWENQNYNLSSSYLFNQIEIYTFLSNETYTTNLSTSYGTWSVENEILS